jgi:hypothetical protein
LGYRLSAQFSGYYVYADGMFRWDSITPFSKPGTYQSDPGKLSESQTQATGSVQYPNTPDGLREFLSELLTAARSGDQAKIDSMTKQTKIPEYRNWYCSVYIPGSALSWTIPYGNFLAHNEESFKALWGKLAHALRGLPRDRTRAKLGGERIATPFSWGFFLLCFMPVHPGALKSPDLVNWHSTSSRPVQVFPIGAWTDSGSVAAVCSATSAAAVRVFAPFAASVAGASVPAAAFSLHLLSVVLAADGPAPAFAGVSGVPDPASRRAFPAVAGISGPVWAFPC